jgi:hypothetical protein
VDPPGRNGSSGNPPLYCGRQHRSSRPATRSTPRIHPRSQPVSREGPYRKGSRHSRASGPWHSLYRGLSTGRHHDSDPLHPSWRAPLAVNLPQLTGDPLSDFHSGKQQQCSTGHPKAAPQTGTPISTTVTRNRRPGRPAYRRQPAGLISPSDESQQKAPRMQGLFCLYSSRKNSKWGMVSLPIAALTRRSPLRSPR